MGKKFDVIALGELLIDMTDNGVSGQGNTLFEANPGGAPCNVLAMLNKLGRKVGFIGKVGDDIFGYKLKNVPKWKIFVSCSKDTFTSSFFSIISAPGFL